MAESQSEQGLELVKDLYGQFFVQGCVGVCGLTESSKSSDLSLCFVTEAEFFKCFSSYAETNLLKGRML